MRRRRVTRTGSGRREIPFPGSPRRVTSPRIAPGSRREIGLVNAAVGRVIALGARRRRPPAIFAVLARHRRLFRPWLRFAGRLMPRGTLPRRDAELVILRVSALCGSDYEWNHHVRLGRAAGLSDEEIARVGEGHEADGWGAHQRALLHAVEEFVEEGRIGDDAWSTLSAPAGPYDEAMMIELCLLTGHYVMLAGTLNSIGIVPD